VAVAGQKRRDSRFGVLVEEKPHRPGWRPDAAASSRFGTSVLA
jgi:hypothetical protein